MKNQSQQDEEALIITASNGNLDAFNQLVLMYQDLAYNHANALLRDSFLAEDATQESFIKAFQNINSFRGGSFRAWLMRIVTNTVYDMLRKSKRQPTQSLFPEDEYGEEIESVSWLADPSSTVQETVEQRVLSAEIYRMLDELPESYRSVLTLIDIFEMDYTEVAKSLNIPLGTVKSRITRARLRMMDKIKSEGIRTHHPTRTNMDIATCIRSN